MNVDDLLLCPICKNMFDEERKNFLDESNCKTFFFKKGEFIAKQGDIVRALYILSKGSVKTESVSNSGAILNIETIYAPYPLASAFLFAENNKFPVNVIALENCEIVMIFKDAVQKQLAGNETFLQEFMKFNSEKTYFLSERLKFISIKTIKGKFAQYILTRINDMNFTLGMSQTDLAEYFGVTRPALARCISEMVSDKIITIKGKKGKVIDLATLKKLIV